ncbi:MAG: alpha/beta hydrolase, partial [Clostridia bacterium]|nr:alpha/beta hydrolase [Clostridia bacterium]
MVVNGIKIDYYPAGEDCLLIFTGLGGDTKGYENKYVKIAETAAAKYGFSTFVAGVPPDCWARPQEVFATAVEYVLSVKPPRIVYVMGSSAGASISLWYSHSYPQIKRVLAINPVLNLNFHRTREGLEKFAGDKTSVVCGEFDPCAVWVSL